MLFHMFSNQEERRRFGGGDFAELQYCTLPAGTDIGKIVDVHSFWKDDSLYIFGDDFNEFYDHYGEIFIGGVYGNGRCGNIDFYGVNYYTPALTEMIYDEVNQTRPPEWETLLSWLGEVKNYNGFYLLGE